MKKVLIWFLISYCRILGPPAADAITTSFENLHCRMSRQTSKCYPRYGNGSGEMMTYTRSEKNMQNSPMSNIALGEFSLYALSASNRF